MKDEEKSKKQLISDLMEYRQRIAKLEESEASNKKANENSDLISGSKSQTKTDDHLLKENQEILEYLKKSRLFSHLPDRILEQLLPLSHLEDYPAGSEILTEGAMNNKIFFLMNGTVSVSAGGNKFSKLRRKGDIFGEMSIISKKPCSASVVAETPVKLFSIKAQFIGEYTDIEANELENILYRIFAMILTEKLSLTNKKAQQYETIHKDLLREIDERNKYTKALQESESRYRLLAHNISDIIWIFDLDESRFSFISPSVEGITGIKAGDITDFRLDDILTPLSLELANKVLEDELATASRTFDAERSQRLELELYHKDGSTLWTETVAKFMYDKNHQPIAILGATRDINDRKKLQDQLFKSQKMESLGLLAGGVAHDLNNVLSGIVSYPELLLMKLPAESEFRKPLKTIQESGNRAVAIVQDLLTVARGVAITKEPENLNGLVSDYFGSPEFERLKGFSPGVTFKTNLAEDLLNIYASDIHIRKILMNLIGNAAEEIKENGTVSVSTDNRFLDRKLKGYEQIDIGEYAVLAVADDGPGISTRDLKRVFEPFYTKKKMGKSGTGLGLSVVWNVMRDHQGYIDVKTDENGTLFELYFPVARHALLKKDIDLSLTDYQGNGESILIVDDIASQREISSMILDMLGYKYKSVASGEEAIEYLAQNTVDLILLDMIMDPGINGDETYLRIIKTRPGQKAIILSGFSETDDVKNTQSLGAGKYLKKPITIEKLGVAIKEELAK
ncbi:MAG: response regulator [Proteobacteria bacterium]|nr:response regulator [Pseudomonadota bacterium]MBU1714710.1 response regulator [Pseudomonadota bacterium]